MLNKIFTYDSRKISSFCNKASVICIKNFKIIDRSYVDAGVKLTRIPSEMKRTRREMIC
jgi:hypothetical protein